MTDFTRQDLLEAKRQLASTLHKIEKVIETLGAKEDAARYKSQLTLARRRKAALEISLALIDEKLERMSQ